LGNDSSMTRIAFKGPAAYVADLDRSRAFYEDLLGLTVARVMMRDDRPIAVAYREGISIWAVDDAWWSIAGDAAAAPTTLDGRNWENCFETPDFGAIHDRLHAAGAHFAHPLRALPWGQLGFRVHDPDGHIVDVSEAHDALVHRLHAEGMSREAIGRQVSLSPGQVDAALSCAEDASD